MSNQAVPPQGVTLKKRPDGTPNPMYIDWLKEDPPIEGQKWSIMSFVDPGDIIKQKHHFEFEEFLKRWEFDVCMKKFVSFLNFVSYKYTIPFDSLSEDFTSFVKEETIELSKTKVVDEFSTFIENNHESLQKQFDKLQKFKTNVMGLMSRGNFPSEESAKEYIKELQLRDTDHNYSLVPVGVWAPFPPKDYQIKNVVYLEEELNQLMCEKTKNDKNAKNEFDARVKESTKKAIDENIKKAELSGNVLTQTLDEDGNLVSVGANSQEQFLNSKENVTAEDVRSVMFDGDNIVVGKSDNGRSLLKSGPFATTTDTTPN
jgi:hypothetical protein